MSKEQPNFNADELEKDFSDIDLALDVDVELFGESVTKTPLDRKPTAEERVDRQPETDAQDKVVVDNLEKIAAAHGRTMAQESLAWMLSKPGITAPIVGSTAVRHIEEAVSALDIKLDPEEIAALEAPYVPHVKTGAF